MMQIQAVGFNPLIQLNLRNASPTLEAAARFKSADLSFPAFFPYFFSIRERPCECEIDFPARFIFSAGEEKAGKGPIEKVSGSDMER